MSDKSSLEMQTHLQMQLRIVAERIVEAARLAAAAHLYGSLETTNHYGQRIEIGGAGPIPPVGPGDSRPPTRPPRAETVTDDDVAAPQPTGRHGRFSPAD